MTKSPAQNISLDRSLPHSLDAERSVIGAVLLEEKAIFAASEIILADDYYLDAHRLIWKRLNELCDQDRGLDRVTLINELRRHDELEKAGGAAYIAGLTEGLPRIVNVKHYARIVREKASLRRLIQAADETMTRAYQDEESPQEILERHESEIFKIAAREVAGGFRTADDLVTEAYKEIEAAANHKTAVCGLPTGLVELDRMTGGLTPGDLVIVAARPSLGKTSLVCNISAHAAIRCGKTVAIFSLETNSVALIKTRILAPEAEVDCNKLRTGYVTKEDWSKLGKAAGAISQARIHVNDGSLNMIQIRAAANRLHMQSSLDLVVIDYMQLMSGYDGKLRENRNQEMTAISRGCKQLAKELGCVVIAISQLSRRIEQRGKDSRPQLSDLRESGAIEQDADLVVFIHREEKAENEGTAELVIGKQRNGPTGAFNVAFVKQYTKFANLWQEGDLPYQSAS